MDAYQAYTDFHRRLVRGEDLLPPLPAGTGQRADPSPARYPRLGIYTGGGSSHSWLWFVEVLERLGFIDLVFLDEEAIGAEGLEGLDVLAVSGGDTFAMARALGRRGAERLEDFIRSGGLYLGACAGAYLMMRSSKEPLNLFNLVPVRISNLARELPQALNLLEKFSTPYGCHYVFHPVREAVLLKAQGRGPFAGAKSFPAPLYGGPAMLESRPEQVLARYQDFTERTLFLADPQVAARTLLGRAAVIREELGRGRLYLFGPHFEHPRFPQANRLLADAIYWDLDRRPRDAPPEKAEEQRRPLGGEPARAWLHEVKRWLSNARVVALALEGHPARWTIGSKVYEPAKFRVFIEALWPRLRRLERSGELYLAPGETELDKTWRGIAQDLRRLKQGLDRKEDTQELAAGLFPALNRACACFLGIYFHTALKGLTREQPQGRLH